VEWSLIRHPRGARETSLLRTVQGQVKQADCLPQRVVLASEWPPLSFARAAMYRHVRHPLTLTLLAFVLAACGGSQRASSSAGITSAFDAVPTDVTYAFGLDFGAMPASALDDIRGSAAEYLTAITEMGYRSANEEIGTLLINAIANPTEHGLAPDGQFVVFSSSLLPLFVMDIGDEALFADLIASFARLGNLQLSSSSTIGGREFAHYVSQDVKFDISVEDGIAVVRVRAEEIPNGGVNDLALANSMTGNNTWLSSASHRSLVAESGDPANTVSFATIRTAAIAEAFIDVAHGNSAALGNDVRMGYSSAEEQELCEATAEAFIASFPGLSMLSYVGEGAVYASRGRLEMSRAASERLQSAFQPVLTPTSNATSQLPLFFSTGLDIAALLNAVQADEAASECPSIAALPGSVARARAELQRDPEAMNLMAMLPGAMTLAIQDMNFSGLIPDVIAAISLGSSNAPGLADFLESQLRSTGLSASVDETATVPTVEFSTFGFSLRLMQFDDRVVVATGELASDVVASVSLPPTTSDSATMQGSSHYPSLLRVLNSMLDWAAGTGGQTIPSFIYERTNSLEEWDNNQTSIELDARGIVIQSLTTPL
jgi:hypothetical protein